MLWLTVLLLGAAALFELILGARLLWLARLTRGAAERSLGVAFFVDAFAQASGAVAKELPLGSSYFAAMTGATVLTVVATSALLFGIVSVFEQHRPGLARVVWALVGAMIVAHVLVIVLGAGPLTERFISARWLNRAFSSVAFAWAAIESFAAYRACLRQLRLGLSSRLEAVRFLFWGGAATAFLLVIVLLFLRDVAALPPVVSLAHPLLAATCVILVWWTFFPPRWLERRLEGSDAAG